MKSSESIAILYNIINEKMGSIEAKNFISDVLYNALSQLEDEGQAITEKSIEIKLQVKANDFLEASKDHVA